VVAIFPPYVLRLLLRDLQRTAVECPSASLRPVAVLRLGVAEAQLSLADRGAPSALPASSKDYPPQFVLFRC